MTEEDIDLGYRVRDRIGGAEYIVTDIAYHLTGCTRFGAYEAGGSRASEGQFFYGDELEVVDENTEFVDDAEEAIREVDFELGDEVEDTVTGFSGVVTTITYNLYNCPRVGIRPQATNVAELPEKEWFDAPCVEKTGDGVSDEFEDMVEEERTEVTGSCGPDVVRPRDKA